jgi:hypothetical protein
MDLELLGAEINSEIEAAAIEKRHMSKSALRASGMWSDAKAASGGLFFRDELA